MKTSKQRVRPWAFAAFAVIVIFGFAFTGCNDGTEETGEVAVTGVKLNKEELELPVEDEYTLTATVLPANATDKKVFWSTSDSTVATVDKNGKVTAKAKGPVTITVTTQDGGKTADCEVTVIAPGPKIAVTGVTLAPPTLDLEEGHTAVLTATVEPSTASNKNVTWESSNDNIATVADGTVTARAEGEATITVTTEEGGETATCKVTVTPRNPDDIAVTGVTVAPTSLTLPEGSSANLTATVSPSEATDKTVRWVSSNPNVAIVTVIDNDDTSVATVTAKAEGTATITVTTEDNGETATCSVTVDPVPVTGVTLSPKEITLQIGGATGTLTPAFEPPNASDKDVTWTTSAAAVATVADGVVTAVAPGTAIITVKTDDGGIEDTCTVTVQRPVTEVSITTTSFTLYAGAGTGTLSCSVLPSGAATVAATDRTVTWTSSDPTVASVVNTNANAASSGTVTGHKVGTATITVTTNGLNAAGVPLSASREITVSAPNAVTAVTVNNSTLTLAPGGATGSITPTVQPTATASTVRTVTWKSSNPAVATVSWTPSTTNAPEVCTVTPVAAGIATITVTTNGLMAGGEPATATCEVTVGDPSVVAYVAVGRTTLPLNVASATGTITCTVTPATANKTVTWSSSAPTVATVAWTATADNPLCTVTPVGEGTATITVTTNGLKANGQPATATCEVTVVGPRIAVTGVTLGTNTLTLYAGGSTGSVTPTVLPATADRTVTWTSSNPAVATVSWVAATTNAPVTITPLTPGETTITVTTNGLNAAGNTLSASRIITVSPPMPVTGVSANPTTLTLYAGGPTGSVTPTVLPANTNADRTVTWSSDNEAVATVAFTNADGATANNAPCTVTPLTVGQAIITVTTNGVNATNNSLFATCTVNVLSPDVVSGVTLNRSTLTLATVAGAKGVLTAAVQPPTALNQNVTWLSSNEGIVTVANGIVTPVAVGGPATITVTTADGNKTATCAVTVYPPLIDMVPITGGSFMMGSPEDEPGRTSDVGYETRHQVTLDGFSMGKYEVTQDQWRTLMSNLSYFPRTGQLYVDRKYEFPAETLNWTDAIRFCNLLSLREGLDPVYSVYRSNAPQADTLEFDANGKVTNWTDIPANWSTTPADWGLTSLSDSAQNKRYSLARWVEGANGYRLPTEAEWEYACRAGANPQTIFNTGNTISGGAPGTGQANFGSLQQTLPCGEYSPNALGLYDMHGNVGEWCWDWYGPYPANAVTNPRGPTSLDILGTYRVIRGGSFLHDAADVRSAARVSLQPYYVGGNTQPGGYNGFRVVRNAE
jgi:uncharacterized protein YjdB/formylglycine-generating enzyme required for sulfatase activity